MRTAGLQSPRARCLPSNTRSHLHPCPLLSPCPTHPKITCKRDDQSEGVRPTAPIWIHLTLMASTVWIPVREVHLVRGSVTHSGLPPSGGSLAAIQNYILQHNRKPRPLVGRSEERRAGKEGRC